MGNAEQKRQALEERVRAAFYSFSDAEVSSRDLRKALKISRQRLNQLVKLGIIDRIAAETGHTVTVPRETGERSRARGRQTDEAVKPYLYSEELSQREIAERTGSSESTVGRSMRRQGVRRGWGPLTVARKLATMGKRGKKPGPEPGQTHQSAEQVAKRVASRRKTLRDQGRTR